MRALVPLLLALCTAVSVGCSFEGEPTRSHRPSDASADVSEDVDPEGSADGTVGDGTAKDVGDADDAALDAIADATVDVTGDSPAEAEADVQIDSGPTGSCATATGLGLPPVGETATLVLDLVGADAQLAGSCGGSNVERVVWFQPSEDAAVLITAGGPGSFSPVLYLLADQCVSGVGAEELACQSGAPGTQFMAQLEAGRAYFVVVDTNGASTSTTTVLTILRLT